MNNILSARLNYINCDDVRLALENHKAHVKKLREMIQSEPSILPQTRWSSLAGDYEAIALFSYALGLPLEEVSQAFASSVIAYAQVVELRGKEPSFPAFVLTYRNDILSYHPDSMIKMNPFLDKGTTDLSLTNSRKHYMAVCESLIAREDYLADQLAEAIWDPPDASYVGPDSFCTLDEQHLAYGLREMVKGNYSEAHSELEKIINRKPSTILNDQASIIFALIENDDTLFNESLLMLLEHHSIEAISKQNKRNPEFFICIPGLGLCRHALRRRLLTIEQLPSGNIFLPLVMIYPV